MREYRGILRDHHGFCRGVHTPGSPEANKLFAVAVAVTSTANTIAESLRQLRSAQKSPKGAPLYSVLVNRPLGRLFAATARRAGLTPNAVTGISGLFTFVGIFTLALGRPGWLTGCAIAALLVIGYALDAADGQLARLTGGGSLFGEWLDHVVDAGKIVSLHAAVAIMAYRYLPGPRFWLIVPLVLAVASVVHFFGFLLTELLVRTTNTPGKRGGSFSPAMALAKLPTDYGLLCLTFATLGSAVLFMTIYTVITVCTAAYTFVVLLRWAGQMRLLDRQATQLFSPDRRG